MTEETLFAAALDRADPADRAAFLAAHCPDPAARRRVEELLAAHAAAGSFLGRPAAGPDVTTELPASSDPDVTRTQVSTDPDATRDGRNLAPADPDEALAFLKPSPRPGALGRLDHYDVLEVVGSGGFGTVLKAFDSRLHRVVAVKVLAPQLAASGSARARFHREAKTAAAVKDDHVVNIHAVSDDDAPVPYLVMEFVAGQTLQDKLDKVGPLPPKEVLRIGMQAAKGLAAAHAQGLIHRDIKPANILLENGVERVKITDFGLARAADDASLSQSGVVAGTPMYMSPEQARGDALDARSDLFSLGSVLYTLCTGRPPFRAETTLAVLKRVIDDDPRPVRDVSRDVPRWLADVVEKLHAKAPADRFQTAKEVADLLAGYLAELQQQGTVVGRRGVAPRRRAAGGSGWGWWFVAATTATTLLTLGGALGESDPPVPRREVHFDLAVTFAVFGLAVLAPAAGLVPLSRRWGERGLGLAAAALLAAAVNGALGVLAPPVPDVTQPAVVTLRLSDTAVQYRFDGVGANQTGLAVGELSFEPGEHWVWFRHDGRAYRTAKFTLGPNERAQLELVTTAGRGRAFLDGRLLDVTPEPGTPSGGWAKLFNGTDLTGWTRHPKFPGTWSVEKGELVGRDGFTVLLSERQYGDFHLYAEVKSSAGTGVYFRAAPPDDQYPRGWVFGLPDSTLYRAAPEWKKAAAVARAAFPADRWTALEVIARGDQITVLANQKTVADYRPTDPADRAGLLGLHAHAQAELRVRTVEVLDLSAGGPAAGDAARIVGEWDALFAEQDGKPAPGLGAVDLSIRFGDRDFEFRSGGKVAGLGGAYQVEEGKKQVAFTFAAQAAPVRAGYRFTDDRLRLDFAGPLDDRKAADEKARRAQEQVRLVNDLKQLGVAAHNYAEAFKTLPPAAIRGKDGTPLLSWRVALLPFLDEDALYKRFKLDEPWDGPNNKALLSKMPRMFVTPGVVTRPGLTHYRALVGPGAAFEPRQGQPGGVALTEVADGLANTVLVAEAADPVEWTKPDDLPFDPQGPLPKLGIGGRPPTVLYADGRVATLAPGVPDKALRALVTRAGGDGEPVAEAPPEPFAFPPVTIEFARRRPAGPAPAVAPFDEAQARAHQEAWAKHLGVPVEFENAAGIAFRLIPPGEFGMGFTDAELAAVRAELKALPNVGPFERFAADSSGPRHTARITRPFYLAKYETTAAQYRRFLDATKHQPTGAFDWTTLATPGQEERQPVAGVSWADADAFCRWLGAGYELPTEAQWEYAARAGGAGLWSFGSDPAKLIDHAAYGQAARAPGPVGLKAANPFGLFDVYGNAPEWCRDWHVADYYRRAPINDPADLDPPADPKTMRAVRGGSWKAPGLFSRAAFRAFDHPTNPVMPKGFRVALGGDLKAAVAAAAARRPEPAPPPRPRE